MSFSASTVVRIIEDIGADIRKRFFVYKVTEKQVGLKSLKNRTTSEKIFSCVSETITDIKPK